MTAEDDMSTPSVGGMVERLKGGVKRAAGAALGNDELRREGELHEQKAEALAEAQRAEVEAERRQHEAEDERRAAELTAEQRELLAEEAAEAHLDRIEHQEGETHDAIEERHDQRIAAVEASTRSAKADIASDATTAARERNRQEIEAAAIEAEAEAARSRAVEAEAELDQLN
jgi:colicin import membrane protein